MKRILIADSDPVFRRALALLISRRLQVEQIYEAADTGTLIQMLTDHRPDLLLLNWSIHGAPGPATCILVRNTYPDLKVILFSPNPEDEQLALDAGASFICKGASPEETLVTLTAILEEK